MKVETLEALLKWTHAITAAVQEANPGHEGVLRDAMKQLNDAIQNEELE